jgi:co-chaperonin GroES (HSP10)
LSYDTDFDLTKLTESLPTPTGYRVVVAIAKSSDKAGNAGIIIKPDELVDKETTASIVGLVISMGPDAYNDDKKFPSGPYCQIGDWVSFRAYSGTRFKLNGAGEQEFRMINDDQVEAILPDPTAIERV